MRTNRRHRPIAPSEGIQMTSHAADNHRAYLERSLGAHAAYTLHYHLVWSVRARRPLLQGAVASALGDHLLETSARADITLLAVHIEPEHVHALLSLRPEIAVASAVQRLKGASSRRLRQAFPHVRALHQEALWSTGYFVRSLGEVSVAQAKAYRDRRRAHHGAAGGDAGDTGEGGAVRTAGTRKHGTAEGGGER